MKKAKRVFSPLQYAVSNFFYVIIVILGLAAILGSLVWQFNTIQPRLFGVVTEARATKYYSYTKDPSSGKIVDYTMSVNGRQYIGTQEIEESAYEQKPRTFSVWYMPNDPADVKYVSIRDYWESVAAGLLFLVGVLFLFLPKFGRGIDNAIERGEDKVIKGCVCGAATKSELRVNAGWRKFEQLRGAILVVIVSVCAFAVVSDNLQDSYVELGWFMLVLFSAYVFPFLTKLVKVPHRPKHSFWCRIRNAWIRSVY